MQPVQVAIHRELHVKFNKLTFKHNCVNQNTTVMYIVHIHLSILLSVPFCVPRNISCIFAYRGAVVYRYGLEICKPMFIVLTTSAIKFKTGLLEGSSNDEITLKNWSCVRYGNLYMSRELVWISDRFDLIYHHNMYSTLDIHLHAFVSNFKGVFSLRKIASHPEPPL